MPRRSTGEYPPDWPTIAEAVKEAAGWRCVRCDHPHDPASGHTLTAQSCVLCRVHHLDLDPSNRRWWNLPAVCQRCHLSIQGQVIMERPWIFEHTDWFKPYVAGYYAYTLLDKDLDRLEIEAQLDELLALGRQWLQSAKEIHR